MQKSKRMQKFKRAFPPTCAILGLLALWQGVVMLGIVPNYLVPSPYQVFFALIRDASLLASHTVVTLEEALMGLAIGVAAGFVIAVAMDRFEWLYHALSPLITVSQTIPVIAIAPLLVLWMGFGILPKVVLVAISTFFPVTVALISAFRSIDPDVIDLMRTMGASRVQIFRHAKLPAAARQFFSGLQISVTYAVIGAVIAEWLGGDAGLGVYMTRVRKAFAYDRMFAAIVVVSALSLLLMRLVSLLKGRLMPWDTQSRNEVKGE